MLEPICEVDQAHINNLYKFLHRLRLCLLALIILVHDRVRLLGGQELFPLRIE
jgi:hypothetical protein